MKTRYLYQFKKKNLFEKIVIYLLDNEYAFPVLSIYRLIRKFKFIFIFQFVVLKFYLWQFERKFIITLSISIYLYFFLGKNEK